MYFTHLCSLIVVFLTVGAECKWEIGYHELVGIPRAKSLILAESERGTRIVGGTQVPTHASFPYQAGIIATLTTGWISICGGSLISNNRVLTAAHCWWDGRNQARIFTVVLGSLTIFSGGTRIHTSDVVLHPFWNTHAITHDIAIVRITSVSYNNYIQAILLPTINDVNYNFVGMTATATGYGKTSDAQSNFPTNTSLHQVSLTIITNTECQRSFEETIHGSHMCTGGDRGVGTCEGDSGGPLTVVWNNRRTLVGIVSFGLGHGCERGHPSVYTRVTAFLTWIHANM